MGQEPERVTVVVDGAELSCLVVGDVAGDGQTVVLLHGWPQTSAAWSGVVPALVEAGYRVIAPDLRGTGASSRETVGSGKDDQADDLIVVLDRLGATGPVHLVGHDIGGMVAFALARQHPERVRTLVLAELALPGLGLEQAMDVAAGGRWHFGFFMSPPYAELLIEGHEDAFFSQWFDDMAHRVEVFGGGSTATYVEAYRGRDSLRSGFGHYRTLLEDGERNAAWVRGGGRLAMPVLAMGGEHAVGDGLARSVAPVADEVVAAVVADSGHFVAEENPSSFLAALLPFLTER